MMRVMHLLSSSTFSGAENVACQIIGIFRGEAGFEMVYCSRDGQIREALAERGIPFAPIADITVGEVKRAIREQKPDVIHAHDMRAGFIAARACGSVPMISHVHNNNRDARGLSAKSVAYLPAGCKAKHILWVSQSAYDGYLFHSVFRRKSTVLYNVIDSGALYRRMQADEAAYGYDLIYVGRLTHQKNPQRLMRVLRKVADKLPDIKVAVVGTGDLEKEARDACGELNLNGNIAFLGFQSNPLKMLHDAKAMLMTSRWEGTPMCALEAMALGVPIVSTPVDGMLDLVVDGETGYLAADDAALAERLVAILRSPELRRRLSEKAAGRFAQLSDLKAYRERIQDAYRLCE